uniref:AAA+ ATPase domain-containing protein n=1 Tax=Eutreptiella gymnastica TaxID=73025 RepID=A0A7S4G5Q8_9EUGL
MAPCHKKKYRASLEFREKALKALEMQKRSDPHFGNAGAVANLLKAALAKASAARKCQPDGALELLPEDISDRGTDDKGADPFAELEKLYRMEHVRAKLEAIRRRFAVADEEGDALPILGHFVFTGAPGTGKTTVARILGKMLFRCGLIARPDVVETDGLKLTGEAVGQTKKKVEDELKSARGGVLFIDEAYDLGKGTYGSEACSALVAAMTDQTYAGLVIVMAGYQADMQSMLDTNPGLKSRFKHFLEFPDWEPADCLDLLETNARTENFVFEEWESAAKRVMERGFKKLRQLKGWANARDVRQVWDDLKERRAERLSAGPNATLGGKSFSLPDVEAAMESLYNARMGTVGGARKTGTDDPFAPLDGLYRMGEIRRKLQQLKNTAELLRREGEEAPAVGHFVFLGAPGTGKTTVARVMSAVLYRLDLIPRDHLVQTSGLDLTGQYVGETKRKVKEELDRAKGGVLFVDEAYELASGQYGKEAVTALVDAMTSEEYAGLCIVIAGYKADIDAMLETNVGLKSRFGHFWEFPDWTPEDCLEQFLRTAKQKQFCVDEGAAKSIIPPGFKKLLPLKGWANARDVQKVWEGVMQNRADRVMGAAGGEPALQLHAKEILPEDIKTAMDAMVAARLGSGLLPSDSGTPSSDPFAPLDELCRMESVKRKLQELQNAYIVAKQDGEEPPPLGHFLFVGSPGTGKTTVARALADVLCGLGLISRRHVEETSGLEMTGQYVGQTKEKVHGLLAKAKGGVLFIDEAYTLGQGQFGSEACDTLVAAMTDPRYAGLVVVAAGYRRDIDDMLRANSGLKSRFSHTLEFPDWGPEDCVRFFKRTARAKSLGLDEAACAALERGFAELVLLDGWGNARDVIKVWQATTRARASRVVARAEEACGKALVVADVATAIEELIRGRTMAEGTVSGRRRAAESGPSARAADRGPAPSGPPMPEGRTRDAAPTPAEMEVQADASSEKTETALAAEEVVCNEAGGDGDGDSRAVGRDPGVSDEDWAEIQMAKEEEQRYAERVRQEEEERKRLEAELAEALRQKQLAREAYEARMREIQRQKEEAERRLREEQRIKERLRKIGNCPMGFAWYKQGGGWRCGGGSHFVSDAELHRSFGFDA